MIEDLVIGLHGATISLKIILAFAGGKMVWNNMDLYGAPLHQSWKNLSRMALWLSIPIIVISSIISRSLNLFYYVRGEYFHDESSTTVVICYLSLTAIGLLLALLWINHSVYGERGLRHWIGVVLVSAGVGVLTTLVSTATL